MHLSRTGAKRRLEESGREDGTSGVRTRRWSAALVVAEVVLTVVLLTGAVSMMRHLADELSVKSQVDAARLLMISLRLPEEKYPTREERSAFYRRLEERLAGLSNIPSIALATLRRSSRERHQISSTGACRPKVSDSHR